MEKIGIFSTGGGWTSKRLKEKAVERGIDCVFFSLSDLVSRIGLEPKASCQGHDLVKFDALIVRWVPKGSAEQIVFRMDLLHRLQKMGIRVLNPPPAIEKCTDKSYTTSLLAEEGFPVPRTVVAENREDAEEAFEKFGDAVVKPLFGSSGTGIMRVDDEDLVYRTFDALDFGDYVYYIQEFIPHDNRDFRIFVLGDEVLCSMERVGEDWRTNCAKGGEAKKFEPSEELVEMSLEAARLMDCEYAGVDVMESEGEHYVVEVNAIPGWEKLQSVSEPDIADELINYLEEDE